MSAIGSGQYVLVEMWFGDELVHRGILPPGHDCALRFSDGPQRVSSFSLRRLTKAEADAIPDDTGSA